MPKVILNRDCQWTDKLRKYSVLIDNKTVGFIKSGESLIVEAPVGQHSIRVTVDWCGSPEMNFQLGAEGKAFACYSRVTGIAMLGILYYLLFAPSSYLGIREEKGGKKNG